MPSIGVQNTAPAGQHKSDISSPLGLCSNQAVHACWIQNALYLCHVYCQTAQSVNSSRFAMYLLWRDLSSMRVKCVSSAIPRVQRTPKCYTFIDEQERWELLKDVMRLNLTSGNHRLKSIAMWRISPAPTSAQTAVHVGTACRRQTGEVLFYNSHWLQIAFFIYRRKITRLRHLLRAPAAA